MFPPLSNPFAGSCHFSDYQKTDELRETVGHSKHLGTHVINQGTNHLVCRVLAMRSCGVVLHMFAASFRKAGCNQLTLPCDNLCRTDRASALPVGSKVVSYLLKMVTLLEAYYVGLV